MPGCPAGGIRVYVEQHRHAEARARADANAAAIAPGMPGAVIGQDALLHFVGVSRRCQMSPALLTRRGTVGQPGAELAESGAPCVQAPSSSRGSRLGVGRG